MSGAVAAPWPQLNSADRTTEQVNQDSTRKLKRISTVGARWYCECSSLFRLLCLA